ncbi:hypothetical protein HHI36_004064 [Cryptolaemus montrouzieri]|uniref:Uncharacterized protein n=1 Tax=Cryptolaemus montrouzieri TaxID=559131 RepID=A0ABD2NQ39_9CUCU
MLNRLAALFFIKTIKKDLESEKAYKTYKEIFKMKVKTTIIDINENYVDNSNNKSRAMWNLIKKKTTTGKNYEKSDSNLTANEMNEYFAAVGKLTAKQVKKTGISFQHYL